MMTCVKNISAKFNQLDYIKKRHNTTRYTFAISNILFIKPYYINIIDTTATNLHKFNKDRCVILSVIRVYL